MTTPKITRKKKDYRKATHIEPVAVTAYCPLCESQLYDDTGCLHIPIDVSFVLCKCGSKIRIN